MGSAKLKRLEKIEETIESLQNERKILKQEYNAELKRARNHRICKRGGFIEKVLPELKEFSDEQFKDLLETLLTSGFAQKRVAEIKGKDKEPEKPAPVTQTPVKPAPVTVADTDEDEDESTDDDSPYI